MTLISQHRPASSALGCLLSGVLLSVGIVLCLFNSWATECSLGECSLYSGAMVFGASLFAWGAGTFGLLICALPTRYFSTISFLALSADVPLLLWQVIYGPCGKCLLVAGLLVANALVITWGGFPVRRSCKIALRVAAALLCINLSALVGNAVRPWLTEQISTTPALKELRIFLPPSRLLLQDQFTGSSAQ